MRIELIVETGIDYIRRMLPDATEDAISAWLDDEKNDERISLIDQIIALQVAFYVTRRTQGVDGSVCDTIGRMKFYLITKYEDKFGTFIDYNKDVSY